MRIVRFSAPAELGVGADPLFGVLNDQDSILVLRGDPIYSGIVPQDKTLKLSDVKLLAPVIPRSKVVCIGKNYADHAAEMGSVVPTEPIIFIKPNTSVIGPNETIVWPKMSERVDHEVELAIVIGRICKEVPAWHPFPLLQSCEQSPQVGLSCLDGWPIVVQVPLVRAFEIPQQWPSIPATCETYKHGLPVWCWSDPR